MSKTDSITLWRSRIQSRKLSGLKVNDWCKQNSISRHAYYYWYRKLKNIKEEQGIFGIYTPNSQNNGFAFVVKNVSIA